MRSQLFSHPTSSLLVFLAAVSSTVHAVDILKTSGFTSCLPNADIQVDRVNVQYNRADKTVSFDVSGSSAKVQNVTASLVVTAYGNQVYQREFDPCDPETKYDQLCPGKSMDLDCGPVWC